MVLLQVDEWYTENAQERMQLTGDFSGLGRESPVQVAYFFYHNFFCMQPKYVTGKVKW